jgi:8-oxo-dGTP pyrophosphatase MutT (NUDIX family)
MIIDPQDIRTALALTQDKQATTCPPLPGIEQEENQPAAVLIPLIHDQQEWSILFIKRTKQENDRHSGQIAFPGGRFEQADPSLMATALRETAEEIGILPSRIEVLGQSCSITTVTGYEITPFVGILPWPATLSLSTQEVEKTLIIPLSWLADPNNHRRESWQSQSLFPDEISVIYFEDYQGEILWGATAQLTLDFLELLQIL